MTKLLATLMIGATLMGAAPALAGNSADIIQQGGGFNSIHAKQKGHHNDFASSQDGFDNLLKLKLNLKLKLKLKHHVTIAPDAGARTCRHSGAEMQARQRSDG